MQAAEQKKNWRILWFTHEWSKLKLPLFTTLRLDKGSKYYQQGKNYAVKIGSWRKPGEAVDRGTVYLPTIDRILLKDMTEELAKFDADCTRAELITQLETWYSKTEHWKGGETRFQLIYCLRVDQ